MKIRTKWFEIVVSPEVALGLLTVIASAAGLR